MIRFLGTQFILVTCFANLISIAAPVNAQILNEPVDLKLAAEDGATREVGSTLRSASSNLNRTVATE